MIQLYYLNVNAVCYFLIMIVKVPLVRRNASYLNGFVK